MFYLEIHAAELLCLVISFYSNNSTTKPGTIIQKV